MSVSDISPISTISTVVLPVTGNTDNVISALPYGVYTGSVEFVTGAANQVAYVYKALGGDVLDIELKADNVYAAYERAVLEFSYIMNVHQSENVLSSILGKTTGSFDHKGEISSGSLVGSNLQSKYPKFDFGYARRVAEALSAEANIGGSIYSASIDIVHNQQEYDLQAVVAALPAFSASVGNTKIIVRKVYYRAASATWRFYGYYGGLNVVGNLSTYGQYADDSVYEVIPTWQNKLQAMAFEDSLWTRTSHYSYELRGNVFKIFPVPSGLTPEKIWFQFTIPTDPWIEDEDKETGICGVNNFANIPFANIPYDSINSMGKHWIRNYALALSKEILGQVRGKFNPLPIPDENITLNADALLSQSEREIEQLRAFLIDNLDKMLYKKLIEADVMMAEQTEKLYEKAPMLIFRI